MKIFSCYQVFRSIWLTRPPGRLFHKVHWLWVPLALADFEAINLCERPLPENFNFAGDVLDQWSQKEKNGERPASPALWWVNGKGDEVKWSFGELGSLSRKAANVLTTSCGLQRGDRVAVLLPRIPEWWLVNVACMRTGIVGSLNSENKVDLTNPQYTVVVEIIKAVCCLSVVKDYVLFRKYNLQEVVKGARDPVPLHPEQAAHAGNGKAAHVESGDTSNQNDAAEGKGQQQAVPQNTEELGLGQTERGSETQVVQEGGADPELASKGPEGSKSNENDLS